ncbi:MAG: hypothetical protein LGL72_14605, partial [Acidibrevibacterium sp.]|nr:hypothetical protein [Acidibrevibacterium fodinaquatile]
TSATQKAVPCSLLYRNGIPDKIGRDSSAGAQDSDKAVTIMNSSRLNFEDVHIGQEIDPLMKGPLTTPHLMRWSAAMENWHKIHYDVPFAIGHDKLPGLLINGSFKQQFLAQILKDWVGQQGWVWKLRFQFRGFLRHSTIVQCRFLLRMLPTFFMKRVALRLIVF